MHVHPHLAVGIAHVNRRGRGFRQTQIHHQPFESRQLRLGRIYMRGRRRLGEQTDEHSGKKQRRRSQINVRPMMAPLFAEP